MPRIIVTADGPTDSVMLSERISAAISRAGISGPRSSSGSHGRSAMPAQPSKTTRRGELAIAERGKVASNLTPACFAA